MRLLSVSSLAIRSIELEILTTVERSDTVSEIIPEFNNSESHALGFIIIQVEEDVIRGQLMSSGDPLIRSLG